MNNHLQIAELYKIYKSESQPFRKVHRMIDLFESIIKSHTVLIIAEYVKHNKLSDAAKGLLAQGLRAPSLGTWHLFSRVLFEELEKDNYPWLLTDFTAEFVALDKALNIEKTNVIAFRNGYAHGATPIDAQCEADIKKFDSFLTQLMESKWLNASSLEVRDNKVYLACKAGELSLHPMLLYRKEDAESSFAFFNDLKNDKIGLLNYPLSKHYREKDFFTEFHQHLPLNDWKKTGNNEFYQRIEELTETFKGRTIEREKLLQFVLNNRKGYFSIQGNPGIGKSALIAQFFKDLRSHVKVKKLHVIEYFIRRGTQQAQVEYMFNYLIRRTDDVFPAGKEIRAEGKMIFDLQYQLYAKWRLWSEQANGQQLLFLIDGLDEGVENNVVTYMPRDNFDNILIIYGSRPGGHKTIDDLWATLPVENHSKLELFGLGKEDIRALIYEVANKYEVERESAWIDAVQKRSQGNPLYLKLLCNAIENGSIQFNDTRALPYEINEYYKAILHRYSNDNIDGDAILSSLYVFAAAFDYLTPVHLQLINCLGTAQSQRVESTLKEVLYENPLTEEVLDYQLFHESFREFLIQFYPTEIKRAESKLLDFCSTWESLQNTFEQHYTLQHYATHLSKNNTEHQTLTLIKLSKNKLYTSTQKKVLRSFNATKSLFHNALLTTLKTSNIDEALETALALVDIKHEEKNDATTILTMVVNNEIDLVLQRILELGCDSKEDKQNQFTLYMLCIMELTLLESKTQTWRKSAIEKILTEFEEQIPIDDSLVYWRDFFPSHLMYLIIIELATMELSYLEIYCTFDIAFELTKKGKKVESESVIYESLESARLISSEYKKSTALLDIASELAKQSKNVESESVLQESLECARGISYVPLKNKALLRIASELAEQQKLVESELLLRESLETSIKRAYLLYPAIATVLAKQGKVFESLEYIEKIKFKTEKNETLSDIAVLFIKQSNVFESLKYAHLISDKMYKRKAFSSIASELAEQGKLEESKLMTLKSLSFTLDETEDFTKNKMLSYIAYEYAMNGKEKESLQLVLCINNEHLKNKTLSYIAFKYAMNGKEEESLQLTLNISDDSEKSFALLNIASELAKQGKIVESVSVMQKSLQCARYISKNSKSNSLLDIASELAKQGKKFESESVMQESLESARLISSDSMQMDTFFKISYELAKQGKKVESESVIQESLECARLISSERMKSLVLLNIASELIKQGKKVEPESVMKESLECARLINNYNSIYKIETLLAIASELAKQGKKVESESVMQESLECARLICDDFNSKSEALLAIGSELVKQVEKVKSASVLQESFEFALGNTDDFQKDKTLSAIAVEFAMNGNLEQSLQCAFCISDDIDKNQALITIASTELTKQVQWEFAEHVGIGIRGIGNRHDFWKGIAKEILKKHDAHTALCYNTNFKNEEARIFYLKGWAENIRIQEITKDLLFLALDFLAEDTDAIESFLQNYAIRVLFFENPSQAKKEHLNKIFNFQWALDILENLPKEENTIKLSTSIELWLHEIEDEDDRDQIMLWSKQAAKGKITEEEFQTRIKNI